MRLILAGTLYLTTLSAEAQVPSLTRVGEIGCADCGTAAQFATIYDVSVTDSGLVLVLSSEEPTVRLFDRSGRVRWTAGRAGTGPGEYRLPIRASMGPRGVQVVDMTLRRVTRLDGAGKFVNSAPITGFASAVGARGQTGELVLLIDDFRGTFTMHRYTQTDSGQLIGTVPRSPTASPGLLTIPSIATSPAGVMAVLRDPNDYRIVLLSPTGEPAGEIVREIPRVKRTAEEIAAIEKRRAAQSARVKNEMSQRGGRPGPGGPIRSSPDELKPHIAIDGLRYDRAGRLWAKTMRGNERSTVFDIFGADHRYLGEVVVPAAIGAFAVAARWFAADVESDDGTPRVVIWEVR